MSSSSSSSGGKVRKAARLGHRKFEHSVPMVSLPSHPSSDEHHDRLLQNIRESVVGHNATFLGPYGRRQIVYTDYTASGKPLGFIEDYLRERVMPFYANTHTTTSVCGIQTSFFRQEARTIIKQAVNAGEKDALIFAGSGATGALNALVHGLQLDLYAEANPQRPAVVFVSPYEHHSNLLPWREAPVKVVVIREDANGALDLGHLEEELQAHAGEHPLLVGSFAAASNITGLLVDTDAVSVLMHTYGGIVAFDYASAGPYVELDINPKQENAHKDAIIVATHKFVGGPGTPGILVFKKAIWRKDGLPHAPGGGTVFFVHPKGHQYLQDVEEREEGGTPDIIGSVRAGLVFQLKRAISAARIEELETALYLRAVERFAREDNVVLLGPHDADTPRLPILSVMVTHASGRYLHCHVVAAILNDVFGIQARSGCLCAGPYAQSLLGIDDDLAMAYEMALQEDVRLDRDAIRRADEGMHELLRPGVLRFNLPFFMTEAQVDFVLEAVCMVARHGASLLPQYRLNVETGAWRHTKYGKKSLMAQLWLGDIQYTDGFMDWTGGAGGRVGGEDDSAPAPDDFKGVLQAAQEIFDRAEAAKRSTSTAQGLFDKDQEALRWFVLAHEVNDVSDTWQAPFRHKDYNGTTTTETSVEVEVEVDVTQQDDDGEQLGNAGDNSTAEKEEEKEEEEEQEQEEGLDPKTLWKWKAPPKPLVKSVMTALMEFDMLEDGDCVMLGISGGKDSLSMLHIMHQCMYNLRSRGINIELAAVTVNPETEAYDPSPLIPYMEALGIPYFFESQNILQSAGVADASSICSYCSRMKRGRLYHAMRREGYNVLALGQHLDDAAESTMMGLFHNGVLRSMKAAYEVGDGDLRVIRPLILTRENDLRTFAHNAKLPVINENCPACFEAPKERQRMKQLLAANEVLFPQLFHHIASAIRPLMRIRSTGMENKESMDAFFATLVGTEEAKKMLGGDEDEE